MTLQNLLAGGAIVALLSIVEISKIQINPWTSIWNGIKWVLRHIGKAINGELIARFDELNAAYAISQTKLDSLKACLDEHIRVDDNRDADAHRMAILQFNNSLLRNRLHTKEEFIEVLAEIDYYEDYCKHHEDYSNNRAVLAVENIRENYKRRLQKHDFLQDGQRR